MSVTVVGNSVEFQHGGKDFKIPFDTKEQAEGAAEELTQVENKMLEQEKKLGVTPEQYINVLEQQAVKQEHLGNKLDTTV